MRYLNTFFILITFFQVGCYGDSQNGDVIEYNKLSELDIHISIEIKESENFLPARLRDLIIAEDGSLIVSDWGNMSIVHFNSDGSFKRELAEKGQGPGELKTFFSLIDSKRDTLLVKFFGMSGQTDVYIRDELENSYLYDYSLITELENNRLITIIKSAPVAGYFAIIEDLNQNQRNELFNTLPYKFETLGIVNTSAEILIDSVHVLQTPNTVFIEAENGAVTPLGAPPFLNRDRIKSLDKNKYFIAKPGDNTIQIFDQNHQIHNEFVLDVRERTVTESDLDYQLRNIPEQFQRELRERASAIKPDFIDIWASNEYFLLQTDENDKGKEMVLLTNEGKAIGKFSLSHFDEIHDFKNQRIYTLHKDQESGHSIRVYEVNM